METKYNEEQKQRTYNWREKNRKNWNEKEIVIKSFNSRNK